MPTTVANLLSVSRPELVALYAQVFAGPDWFEVDKCTACGRAYPGPIDTRAAGTYAAGDTCWNEQCAVPLELISFYEDPTDRLGQRILEAAIATPGFIGQVAVEMSGELVGFSWGYAIPELDTPSVRFTQVRDLLTQAGVDPDTCFYAAETGVIPTHQRAGVGRALVEGRLREARQAGHRRAVFRTIDRERLVGLYESLFDSVVELFPDPDPAKSQIWYAVDL